MASRVASFKLSLSLNTQLTLNRQLETQLAIANFQLSTTSDHGKYHFSQILRFSVAHSVNVA